MQRLWTAPGSDQDSCYLTLQANPAVALRLSEQEHPATARVVTDAQEADVARQLLYDKYNPGYGGDLAGWRDTALPVAIDRTL